MVIGAAAWELGVPLASTFWVQSVLQLAHCTGDVVVVESLKWGDVASWRGMEDTD